MKEQLKSAVLPSLPIVGKLKLATADNLKLYSIEVVQEDHDQELSPFFQKCYERIEAYLSGRVQEIDLLADLGNVSVFQKEVLEIIRTIPYGKTMTYKEIAQKLDLKAYQAIGSACGKNPLLLIYPCHRVVGTHNPGGFAHGLPMKQALLKLETR
jgi:O-6-methylguanine DNA methyltransferase